MGRPVMDGRPCCPLHCVKPVAHLLKAFPTTASSPGWDLDSYLWRLAGRGEFWAWGPPGLRAPLPPV